ncbi:transcription initiation factor TFIID subunit 4b isoform X2 [Elaeis guineensis]|uniref:Transcription initiation factor TFIID subunit 4b isoform X2 n=1 Tax=Elaeis guineensis var. tenera TaxID=51953 RepID=A0A6I9S7U9_ELAGV|nr:transcription initiation factor TFIID subunit 4b isoform X2 [Elaeis guineensis]
MDPSIMKLLEDDVDESMHSGADVEAFTAALNRDIGGDAAAISHPSEPDTVGVSSQGSSSASKQILGQWENSMQEDNPGQQIQQQEQQHLQSLEQQSSQTELIRQESGAKDKDQQVNSQPEHDRLLLQQEQSHSENQQLHSEPNPLQFVEKEKAGTSEQTSVQGPKHDITQHSGIQQQHKVQQLNSQQAPAANQANSSMRRMKVNSSIPFHMLIPILRPHLDKDRSMQLMSIFTKLRTNEVSKEDFLRVIRNIVGDQMLRQAAQKVQMQLHAQSTRNAQTNPNQYSLQTQASSQQISAGGAQQFVESQSVPPLHLTPSSQNQKGPRSPPRQPYPPLSTVQMQADTSNLASNIQKSREIENKSDAKGYVTQNFPGNVNTMNAERDISMNSLQAVNKLQQHTQLPQTSFSMYGSTQSNFHGHPYPRPSISGATTSLKSQTQDSLMRQAPHTQGVVMTQLGPTQPVNVMNMPKSEVQNVTNETKRLQSGSLTNHAASQHHPVAWQLSANKEQRSGAFPPMSYVKQEVADPPSEPPHKSQFTTPEGSSFGSLHSNQGNQNLESSKEETLEKQSSKLGYATPASMMGNKAQVSNPMVIQGDQTVQNQMQSQISSATPPLQGGPTTRTPQKKPPAGQKKPHEALGTSPPMSSKKQKTTGAFLDQSIEQLNDVTAVSGVNLREEEEQLLSGPKEESRASEATRRVVQEEEERLILQKGPLQKKLADIMSKCGLKSISSDVERCLSMCMGERLRGLISYLIRLSKQRVDIEKTRHRFVITSDVRRQILFMNKKAKEEWDKKQTEEAEKLRKVNEVEGNAGADTDKDKDEGRSKTLKANKEEDDKMRTTAANVAARAAVGGDDMLSKWQLMAEQARQKREGLDGASGSQPGKTTTHKTLSSSGRISREQQEAEKKGLSAAAISGGMRKLGRSPVTVSHPKVARSISIKDVIAVLEREPQMSKSTLIYQLYERLSGDSAAE